MFYDSPGTNEFYFCFYFNTLKYSKVETLSHITYEKLGEDGQMYTTSLTYEEEKIIKKKYGYLAGIFNYFLDIND